jgi:hypothetical protein
MEADLEEKLREFNKQFEKEIVFDTEKNHFYEVVCGQIKEIRFPDYKPDTFSFGMRNYAIESQLPPAEAALRNILIEYVDKVVDDEFVENGGLKRRGGEIYPAIMGICHSIWARKQEILKKYYNITWASPKDENPGVMYD